MRAAITITAVVALFCGFWTGCTVGFDPTDPETGSFSCTDNTDCLSPNTCKGGVCVGAGPTTCVDADGDGFGVGETGDCDKCINEGLCGEDCNDNDASIYPGLADTCDGKDNDCDDEVDEPLPCENSIDCPDEGGGTLPSCENGTCIYKPALQLAGRTECQEPLECVNGEREEPPSTCQ